MLFVLDAAGDDDAALAQARDIVSREIDHPMKVALVVHGDGAAVSKLASDGAMAADRPWRVVLWAKAPGVLSAAQVNLVTGGDPANIAVLLGFDDAPVKRFRAGVDILAIDDAFNEAERKR